MRTVELTESELATVLYALAKSPAPSQACQVLRELQRRGVRIPAWIRRDVLGEGRSQ